MMRQSALRRQRKAADELQANLVARLKLSQPSELSCPRAASYMTPCIARDGGTAVSDEGMCVGCDQSPVTLLVKETRRDG